MRPVGAERAVFPVGCEQLGLLHPVVEGEQPAFGELVANLFQPRRALQVDLGGEARLSVGQSLCSFEEECVFDGERIQDEPVFVMTHAQLLPTRVFAAQEMHGEGIQEFVGVVHTSEVWERFAGTMPGGFGVEFFQAQGLQRLERRKWLDDLHVSSRKTFRRIVFKKAENVVAELPVKGALFHEGPVRRAVEQRPHFMKLPRQQTPEEPARAHGSDEVARLSDARTPRGVVAMQRVVKRGFHETAERNGSAALNVLKELLLKGRHRRGAAFFGEGLPAQISYI